jgi:hypothetical protein
MNAIMINAEEAKGADEVDIVYHLSLGSVQNALMSRDDAHSHAFTANCAQVIGIATNSKAVRAALLGGSLLGHLPLEVEPQGRQSWWMWICSPFSCCVA